MKLIMENWNEYLAEDNETIEEGAVATTLLTALLAAFNMTAGDTQDVAQIDVGDDTIEVSAQDIEGMAKVAAAKPNLSDPFTDWANGIINADKAGGNTVDIASSLPSTATVSHVGGADKALLGDLLIAVDKHYSNLSAQAEQPPSPYGGAGEMTGQQALEQLKAQAARGNTQALKQLKQLGFEL